MCTKINEKRRAATVTTCCMRVPDNPEPGYPPLPGAPNRSASWPAFLTAALRA